MSNDLLLTEDAFDNEIAGDGDPLVKIPAGFPSMHARYQETPPPLTAGGREQLATSGYQQPLSEASRANWHASIARLLDDDVVDNDHAESFDD